MGATGRELHIDVPLSNVAIQYRPSGMIADMIAPIVGVNKQSDGYFVWDIADAYRIVDDLRAPATEASTLVRNISSDTYFAKNYALKDRIPYEDIENADAGTLITERNSRVEFIKDRLMLNMEYRVAKMCTSGTNCGSYSAVASAWTNYAVSDPISDIKRAINNVEDLTGVRPNSVIFGGNAWRHLVENEKIIDRIYGSQTGVNGRIVLQSQVANLFQFDKVLVGGAYRNTGDDGQTASLSRIWADHVLVYYAPQVATKDRPSFMYSFRWNKVMNMQATVYQLERAKAEEVELGYFQDEKITAKNLSFLITNTTSSQ